MLQPKRTKFRKQFKGRIHGTSKGAIELNFGAVGLRRWSLNASPRARSRPRAAPSRVI
jgi:ribosomal protein L16/L10AE